MRQFLGSGAPWELSDEDRAWLNAPPVGLEWPICEENERTAVPRGNAEMGVLNPPPGSNSWLEYALMHLDTRELHRMSMFEKSIWGGEVPSDAFLEAAQHELQTLRLLADKGRQLA